MKRIFTILLLLIAVAAKAQPSATSPLGSTNPNVFNKIKGSLWVDSFMRLAMYANSDTNKVLTIDANGNFVFVTKSAGGSGTVDTTIVATKAFVLSVLADTSSVLRGYMLSLLSNYYTKTESDARYLQSYTETDPVFAASDAAGIDATDISNWNAAHGHITNTSNPHSVTKTQVGLGNVPNIDATNPANIVQTSSYRFVSDAEKSTWNGKQNALGYTPEDVANKATSFGVINNILYPTTQACSTYIAGLGYITGNQIITLSGDASGSGTTTITVTVDKLNGQLPSYYLNRTNHSGTQTASTISDFTAAAAAAAVQDAITDGVTDVAPSQNAVYDALIDKADVSALSGYVPTSRTISTTSPLNGGGDLSTNRTLTIADAAADGSTKGAAAFTADDFNATLGVLSLDYTNGQAASGSNKGFLTSADWTTFNGKVGGSGTANYLAKFTASGTIGNSTIQDDGSNIGLGGAPNASYKVYNNGSTFTNGITYLLGGGSGGIRSTASVYVDALNAGGADILLRFGNNIDKNMTLNRDRSTINSVFHTTGGFAVTGSMITTGTTVDATNLYMGNATGYSELRPYNPSTTAYGNLAVCAIGGYLLVRSTNDDGSGREIQNTGQIGSTDTIYTATVMREAGITSSLLKTTSNGTHAAAVAGTDYLTRSTDTIIYAVAISDMTTALTTGTSKGYFRMPHAATLVKVKASVITASSSGTPTFDINEGGTSVLGTKLTIDANETTSETAASAATITDSALANDGIITFDIDTAGTGTLAAIIYLYVIKT